MSVAVADPVVGVVLAPAAVSAVVVPAARETLVSWPVTRRGRAEVMELMGSAPFVVANAARQGDRRAGLRLLLDWLEDQPGLTWQDRWLSSGAEAADAGWREVPAAWLDEHGRHSEWSHDALAGALVVAICADVVRPSLNWMLCGATARSLIRNLAASRDPDGFAQLRERCDGVAEGSAATRTQVLYRAALIVASKGGVLSDITVGDVVELLNSEAEARVNPLSGGALFYRVLHEMGILGSQAPATLRVLRTSGQRTAEELIDRHRIACRPVRDLLVDYLRERQPALDYTSLDSLANFLGKLFWADIEAHHPGIDTLRLPVGVADAWKRRLRTFTKTTTTPAGETTRVTVERINYRACLTPVRALYLDLAHWAVEDPGRWGPWVAPCPISDEEINTRKAFRHRKSRMDARTRERLPVLPIVVRSVDQRRKTAAALLDAGRQTKPGEAFDAEGTTLVRYGVDRGGPATVWAEDPTTAKRRNLSREEDHAFWSWAVVEVLRATGIRVEELVELSHHSLVQYRLPTTGELVPLLQILPSKTDEERLLVVSPDLADVLSEIIRRNRDSTGAVPLLSAYDARERVWSPRAPLLFQRRVGTENRAIPKGAVGRLLAEALAHTGLLDSGGLPLHYTPHDFRRMFITDAILNGLPPHIAQIIAGHRDINVTLGYKAVYPEEAIQAHLGFLARRRALRPSEEYRVPTDDEWEQFLGHPVDAKSPSEPAHGLSQPRAFTSTPVSAARCSGPIRPSGPASPTSPTISPPASLRPNAKAGRAKSRGCRSAWPAPTTSSHRSIAARPTMDTSGCRRCDDPNGTRLPCSRDCPRWPGVV